MGAVAGHASASPKCRSSPHVWTRFPEHRVVPTSHSAVSPWAPPAPTPAEPTAASPAMPWETLVSPPPCAELESPPSPPAGTSSLLLPPSPGVEPPAPSPNSCSLPEQAANNPNITRPLASRPTIAPLAAAFPRLVVMHAKPTMGLAVSQGEHVADSATTPRDRRKAHYSAVACAASVCSFLHHARAIERRPRRRRRGRATAAH